MYKSSPYEGDKQKLPIALWGAHRHLKTILVQYHFKQIKSVNQKLG
jgi:hypothetical protein